MSEELNARIAELLHYPRCWDTAAYPTVFDAMIETAGAAGCSACMERERVELERQQTVLVEALSKIEKWFGEFPPTGKTWATGEEMSYLAAYGSNGERDFMRSVAREALAAVKPAGQEGGE